MKNINCIDLEKKIAKTKQIINSMKNNPPYMYDTHPDIQYDEILGYHKELLFALEKYKEGYIVYCDGKQVKAVEDIQLLGDFKYVSQTENYVEQITKLSLIKGLPFYDSVWDLEVLLKSGERKKIKFTYFDCEREWLLDYLKSLPTIEDILINDKANKINYS